MSDNSNQQFQNKWNSGSKKPAATTTTNLRDIMQEENQQQQQQRQQQQPQRRKVDITREILSRDDAIPSKSSNNYDDYDNEPHYGGGDRGGYNRSDRGGYNRGGSERSDRGDRGDRGSGYYRGNGNSNGNSRYSNDSRNGSGSSSSSSYRSGGGDGEFNEVEQRPPMHRPKYYDGNSSSGSGRPHHHGKHHHRGHPRGDNGFRTDPDAGYVCRQTEDAAKLELIEPVDAFEDIRLPDEIVRGIYTYGFEHPSMIQKSAVRPVLAGYDIIAQAQSGTGKTAAFCMGALGRVDRTLNQTQVIVLSHTAELAIQVYTVFSAINKYYNARINLCCKKFEVAQNIDLLLGYLTIDDECNAVKKEYNEGDELQIPHLVIGTPGRVIDMIKQGAIAANGIKLLVLDEADELLSSGFTDQIKTILKNLSSNVQVALFSATMNGQFFKLTEKFMRDPVNILIKNEELTLEGIKQYYINTQKNEYKFETLCDLYSILTISQAIIYCNNQQSVDYLTRKMTENNFAVSCIHGGNDIVEREKTMREFRTGATKVLIATDLIGRGIDVQQVSIVINFDIPPNMESYIHRIGRSGRHGRKGVAINFVTDYDFGRISQLEKFYSTEILPLPENLVI